MRTSIPVLEFGEYADADLLRAADVASGELAGVPPGPRLFDFSIADVPLSPEDREELVNLLRHLPHYVKSKLPVVRPIPAYRFPADAGSGTKLDESALSFRLSRAAAHIQGGGAKYDEKWRRLVCTVSVEFNRRELLAPAFRGLPGLKRSRGLTDQEKLYSNDRQVLDLHWLWCCRRNPKLADRTFRSLFKDEGFDFEAASILISTKGSLDLKAEKLGLELSEQFQLAAIRSQKARKAFRLWEGKAHTMEQRLVAAATRASQYKGRESDWPQWWIAAQVVAHEDRWPLVDPALKPSPRRVAELYAKMTGSSPVSDQVATRKLQRIEAFRTKYGLA